METEHAPVAESTPSYSFLKEERLHHKKLIDSLFGKGSSFLVYPFKIVYQYTPVPNPRVQVVVVVPKRNFKKAHVRNRLRRQIKEIFRLHKHRLQHLPEKQKLNLLGIIYVAKEQIPFLILQKKLTLALERLVSE